MSDQTLKQIVLDELAWEPRVNAGHIGVIVRDHVVTLSGHVETYAEKWAAEQSVQRISGVKAVAQELEVRSAFVAGNGDEEIAHRAVNVLAWDVSVPKDKVMVRVEKGRINLSGEVEWDYQRSAAEADIRKLHGVTGITNSITLKPSANASDVRIKIASAFTRSSLIEADDIAVTTNGGKVTLSGKVKSYDQRNLAERTAWSAPGVTQVEDRLTVG